MSWYRASVLRFAFPLLTGLLFSAAATAAAPEKKAPPKSEKAPATKKAERLKIGEEAPPFTLKTVNPKKSGQRLFALRQYAGQNAKHKRKFVVLSFGASYCGPCKKELPELKTLAPKLKKANVELAVVIVDTEPEGTKEMIALCRDKLDLPFAVLSDRFGVLARRYHADQLPLTVVVDGTTGQVAWQSVGFKDDAIARLSKTLGI